MSIPTFSIVLPGTGLVFSSVLPLGGVVPLAGARAGLWTGMVLYTYICTWVCAVKDALMGTRGTESVLRLSRHCTHQSRDTHGPRRLAKQGYTAWVSTEGCDIFLYPALSRHLVQQRPVPAGLPVACAGSAVLIISVRNPDRLVAPGILPGSAWPRLAASLRHLVLGLSLFP